VKIFTVESVQNKKNKHQDQIIYGIIIFLLFLDSRFVRFNFKAFTGA